MHSGINISANASKRNEMIENENIFEPEGSSIGSPPLGASIRSVMTVGTDTASITSLISARATTDPSVYSQSSTSARTSSNKRTYRINFHVLLPRSLGQRIQESLYRLADGDDICNSALSIRCKIFHTLGSMHYYSSIGNTTGAHRMHGGIGGGTGESTYVSALDPSHIEMSSSGGEDDSSHAEYKYESVLAMQQHPSIVNMWLLTIDLSKARLAELGELHYQYDVVVQRANSQMVLISESHIRVWDEHRSVYDVFNMHNARSTQFLVSEADLPHGTHHAELSSYLNDPFNIYARMILTSLSESDNDASDSNFETTIVTEKSGIALANALSEFSHLRRVAFSQWPTSEEVRQHQAQGPDWIETKTIDFIHRFVGSDRISPSQAVAVCCLLGSIRKTVEPISAHRLTCKLIESLEIVSSLEVDFDFTFVSWLKEGVMMLLSSLKKTDRYLWLGACVVTRDIDPTALRLGIEKEKSDFKSKHFHKALRTVCQGGGLAPGNENHWYYGQLVRAFIHHAPSSGCVDQVLNVTKFAIISTVETVVQALVERLQTLEHSNHIEEFVATIERHAELCRHEEFIMHIISMPIITRFHGSSLGIKILRRFDREYRTQNPTSDFSIRPDFIDAVKLWLSDAFRIKFELDDVLSTLGQLLPLKCLSTARMDLVEVAFESPAFFLQDEQKLIKTLLEHKPSHDLKPFIIQKVNQLILRSNTEDCNMDQLSNVLTLLEGVADVSMRNAFLRTFSSLQVFKMRKANIHFLITDPIWERLLSYDSVLSTEIEDAQECVRRFVGKLLDRTIVIEDLRLALKHKDRLLTITGGSRLVPSGHSFTRHHLDNLEREFEDLLNVFNALQVFLTYFCGPYPCYDVSNMLDTILRMREKLNHQTFASMVRKFSIKEVQALRDDIFWFYELRRSEWFHRLWREYSIQEHGKRLGIDDLYDRVIPAVRRSWHQLWKSINERSISLQDLMSKTASHTQSESTLRRELEIMFISNNSDLDSLKAGAWVNDIMPLVTRVSSIKGLLHFLEPLISLANELRKIHTNYPSLQQSMASDTNEMKRLLGSREYERKRLKATQLKNVFWIAPTCLRFVEGLSREKLEFIELLTTKPIIPWLHKMSLDQVFQQHQMNIWRSTDSVRILEACEALAAIRELLAPLISPNYVIKSLYEHIQIMKGMEITDEETQRMNLVVRNWQYVCDISQDRMETSTGRLTLNLLKDLFDSGQYVIAACHGQVDIECQIHRSDRASGIQSLSLSSLMDMRDKLILSEVPDGLFAWDVQGTIDMFIEHIRFLFAIRNNLVTLIQCGHFEFLNHTETIMVRDCSTILAIQLEKLSAAIESWTRTVEESRTQSLFFNFFRMQEVVDIARLCDIVKRYQKSESESDVLQTESFIELWNLMRTASRGIDKPSLLLDHIKYNWTMQLSSSAEQKLHHMVKFIHSLFYPLAVSYRPIRISKQFVQNLNSEFLERCTNSIVVINRQTFCEAIHCMMTIFSTKLRLPEPEEILFCTAHTSMEEIQLILNRWRTAGRHGRGDLIYCVVNAHLLPYQAQIQTVAAIKKELRSTDTTGSIRATLAIIRGSTKRQPLHNLLDEYTVPFKLIDREKLTTVMKQAVSKLTSGITCVVGDAGNGKSVWIMQRAVGRPYRRISMDKNSTMAEMTQLLIDAPHKAVIHIDVGEYCDPDKLQMVFTEIFFVGFVRSRRWFVDPSLAFYIELHDASLCDKWVLLSTMERQECGPTSVVLSPYRYTIANGGTVVEQVNHELLYILGVIHELSNGTEKRNIFFRPVNIQFFKTSRPMELLQLYTKNFRFRQVDHFTRSAYELLHNLQRQSQNQSISVTLKITRMLLISALSFSEVLLPPLSTGSFLYRARKMRRWDHSRLALVMFNVQRLYVIPSRENFGQLDRTIREMGVDPSVLPPSLLDTRASRLMDKSTLASIICSILGADDRNSIDSSKFVVTPSNQYMIIHLAIRMAAKLPTVIIGDTGIGKHELYSTVLDMAAVPFKHRFRLTLYDTTSPASVHTWFADVIDVARSAHNVSTFVYIDQANSISMEFLKQIVVDRICGDTSLPSNIVIVLSAAPYRIRHPQQQQQQPHQQLGHGQIPYDIDALVYKVFPLPESLLLCASNHGAVADDKNEMEYIEAIISKMLSEEGSPTLQQNEQKDFALLIHRSHEFLRENAKERSVVSLRDVRRSVSLFKFFHAQLSRRKNGPNTSRMKLLIDSILLALTYCYLYRVTNRDSYKTTVAFSFSRTSVLRATAADFDRIIGQEIDLYSGSLEAPAHIVRNAALRENIFILLVAIMNRQPLFLIGEPGTSKSLAVEIVARNLAEDRPPTFSNEFELPRLEILMTTCTSVTKLEELQQLFHRARKLQEEHDHSIVVVVLNELDRLKNVQPLKEELDRSESDRIAIVGLANSPLSPKLSNQLTTVLRSEPNLSEVKQLFMSADNSLHLNSLFWSLSDGYCHIRKKLNCIHGLRDFFSLYKWMSRELALRAASGTVDRNNITTREEPIFSQSLSKGVARCFGGTEFSEYVQILFHFFDASSIPRSEIVLEHLDPLTLIGESLRDRTARHLMVVTRNNEALSILFEQRLLDHSRTEVIFSGGHHDLWEQIRTIRECVIEGKTLVLAQCEHLFEELYDLLQQSYREYGGQRRFTQLRLGSTSEFVRVHRDFKLVAIVDVDTVKKLSLSTLQQFEKHMMVRQYVMKSSRKNIEDLVSKCFAWTQKFCQIDGQYAPHLTFAGWHIGMLSSLAISLCTNLVEDQQQTLLDRAINKLLWITTINGIVLSRSKFINEYIDKYFKEQCHTSLIDLLHHFQKTPLRLEVITYSPSSVDIEEMLSTHNGDRFSFESFKVVVLHQLQHRELNTVLSEMCGDESSRLLVVQCDLAVTERGMIQHAKYLVEKYATNINILFIIHVHSHGESAHVTGKGYEINFDARWHFIFLDELRHQHPSIQQLLVNPVKEHIHSIDVRVIIERNYRNAVALMRYPQSTRRVDVSLVRFKERIQRIQQVISDDIFGSLLMRKVQEVTIIGFSRDNALFWSEIIARNASHFYALHGSFYAALSSVVEKMVIKALGIILADVDRNRNLSVFLKSRSEKDVDMTNMFIGMFKRLWSGRRVTSMRKDRDLMSHFSTLSDLIITVPSDGQGRPFSARFPFAFEVCKVMHAIKGTMLYGGRGAMSDSSQLSKVLELHFPGLSVLGVTQSKALIHDYIHIWGLPCQHLDKSDQFILFEKLLKASSVHSSILSNTPDNGVGALATLLQFYWNHERRFMSYHTLIDSLPAVAKPFMEVLNSRERGEVSNMDMIDQIMFNQAYECLDPYKLLGSRRFVSGEAEFDQESILHLTRVMNSSSDRNSLMISWMNQFGQSRPAVEEICSLPRSETMRRLLMNKFQRLMLFKLILEELALPFDLVLSIPLQLYMALDDDTKSLQSWSSVLKILDFLEHLHKSYQKSEATKRCVAFLELFVQEFALPGMGHDDELEPQLVRGLLSLIPSTAREKGSIVYQRFGLETSPSFSRHLMRRMLVSRFASSATKVFLRNTIVEELRRDLCVGDTLTMAYVAHLDELIKKLPLDDLAMKCSRIETARFCSFDTWRDPLRGLQEVATLNCAVNKLCDWALHEGHTVNQTPPPLLEQFKHLCNLPNFHFLKHLIQRKLLSQCTVHVPESAQMMLQMLGIDSHGGNAVSPRTTAVSFHPVNSPHSLLWTQKDEQTIDMDLFIRELETRTAKDENPILKHIIRSTERLRPLRYIPFVVRWQMAMHASLSGKVTKSWCSKHSVEEFISHTEFVTASEAKQKRLLFDEYAKAWNRARECGSLQGAVEMRYDTPIIHCIRNDLAQRLVTQHNKLLEKVSKIVHERQQRQITRLSSVHAEYRGAETTFMALSMPEQRFIRDRFLFPSHCISISEGELITYINRTGLLKSDDQHAGRIDFDRVERFVQERWITGKPSIKMTLERFMFAQDRDVPGGRRDGAGLRRTESSSSITSIVTTTSTIAAPTTTPNQELKKLIKQRDLHRDIKQAISIEITTKLSTEQQRMALKELDECIHFIVHSTKNTVSESNRMDFMTHMDDKDLVELIDILGAREEHSELLRCPTIVQHVKLKHLCSLESVLSANVHSNPLAALSGEFKKPLTMMHQQQLRDMLGKGVDVDALIPALREIMITYCSDDDSVRPTMSLKELLECVPLDQRQLAYDRGRRGRRVEQTGSTTAAAAVLHTTTSSDFSDFLSTTASGATSSYYGSTTVRSEVTTPDEDSPSMDNNNNIIRHVPGTDQTTLGDLGWFCSNFPASLHVSHIYEVYKFVLHPRTK